jgi:hypothetical protein
VNLISEDTDYAVLGESALAGCTIVPPRPLVMLERLPLMFAAEQPGAFPVKLFIRHIRSVIREYAPIYKQFC